jgi:hypothetical protein
MRKQIVCDVNGRILNVAWLSFQPDGAVSFGLNDRTFVSPRLRARIGLFNAYNRVSAEFTVRPTAAGLDPIQNPHFTYHPTALFHLTADKDEEVFSGTADTTVIFSQQPELQWIRAISKRVGDLNVAGTRSDSIDTEAWVIPSDTSDISIRIAVDLMKPAPLATDNSVAMVKLVIWKEVMVRIAIDTIPAACPTLSWFHEY